ncbi:MAG: ABC transporter substrate-binding protein [Paracoccaceae bacterium]|nr:ABC transporter substrate-binding protein [Paracoccaceae bacterium]
MTDFTLSRRAAVGGLIGLGIAPAFPAFALDVGSAEGFVKSILAELRDLIQNKLDGEAGATRFLALLEDKAALPQFGKFAAGRAWRDMSGAQQAAYQDAFKNYIAKTYQKRFGDYAGEDIVVTSSRDLGDKGVLVQSQLTRPNGQNFDIEWLVSDRLGPTKLADIVFEGVSLSITMRELFGGMVDKRNGDIDAFIADLQKSEGA